MKMICENCDNPIEVTSEGVFLVHCGCGHSMKVRDGKIVHHNIDPSATGQASAVVAAEKSASDAEVAIAHKEGIEKHSNQKTFKETGKGIPPHVAHPELDSERRGV